MLRVEVRRTTDTFLAAVDRAAPGLVAGLYLHGSLGFGEFFPGHSDIDFVAVLNSRPDPAHLQMLAAVHAEVRRKHPEQHFDGIHLVAEDLRRDPVQCPDVPYAHEGVFTPAGRFELNPVTWHELARHGIVIRGPELPVWTDDAALRAFTRENLATYWQRRGELLAREPGLAAQREVTEWCVLGVSRLHHLLANGRLTSKCGAGRYAIATFDDRWRTVIAEALRVRETPALPSCYADPAERARDTAEFTAMVVRAGLALAE